MATIDSPSVPANKMEVDETSKAARATLYDSTGMAAVQPEQAQPAAVAGVSVLGLNDRTLLPQRVDRMGNLGSARHVALMHEPFEGATPHATRWSAIATTMAATQSSITGLVINSANITTINTGYLLTSTTRFMKAQRAPMQFKTRLRLNRVANAVQRFGFGDATAFNGACTTGAYWECNAAGVVQPVVRFNGGDVGGGVDIAGSLLSANYYTFDVIMDDDEAIFVCQDTSTSLIISRQSIKLNLTAQRLLSATALPVFVQQFITGVAPVSAPNLIVTDLYVALLDQDRNAPWAHLLAGMGRSGVENPFTGAALTNFTNNTAPANATLSNTVAGYTTLGGNFSFAAVAGAVTDYALFGFQVPAGANFNCTGIDVETFNTGAASATSPTVLQWFASHNQPGVTLASNSFRAGIGVQSIPVGAAIGAKAERLSKPFQTPMYTASGRFFVIGLRMPISAATAAQVIQGNVNAEGYFS